MKSIASIDPNFLAQSTLGLTDLTYHDATQAPFQIFGVSAPDNEPLYKRLPSGIATQISEGITLLAKHTSGVRVRFATDSPYIAIQVWLDEFEPMPHIPPTGQIGFDLYEDGLYRSEYQGTFVPPPAAKNCYEAVVRLEGTKMRCYTINFPLYCGVERLLVGVAADATLDRGASYADLLPIVYYGSSITQGGCASRPGNSYPAIISRKTGFDFINLGFSGCARGEVAMSDYLSGLAMSVLVCDYDHNSTSADFLNKTHYPFYRAIRDRRPELPIILVSRPDFHEDIQEEVKRREVVFTTYMRGLGEGDTKLFYIDGEGIFDKEYRDCSTVDGCHPNDFGFVAMAKVIGDVVVKALNRTVPF